MLFAHYTAVVLAFIVLLVFDSHKFVSDLVICCINTLRCCNNDQLLEKEVKEIGEFISKRQFSCGWHRGEGGGGYMHRYFCMSSKEFVDGEFVLSVQWLELRSTVDFSRSFMEYP